MKRLILLLFIGILLYCITANPVAEGFQAENKVEMVIARYNESLDWIKQEPFNRYPIIIYNKGNNTNFATTDKVQKVISLKNVGKCDHTYFHHIVNRYDNLADITIFLPGSIDMRNDKYAKTIKIFDNVAKYKTTVMIGQKNYDIKNALYGFSLNNYVTSDPRNKQANGESTLIPAQIRPFGKWYENKFGSLNTQYILYTGIFAVAKEDILQHSVSYYQEFLDELSVGSNPEVGHYVERSWQAIFNPPSNRIYIEGFNDDRLV
jgi:Protein of unknown function (DUF3431)